ncbi:uncharacterized protein MONBRDRAFT_27684 [Monosiga brevicollis MX1]|uniref:DUF4062 domain-containing protein n=1 Tax=Monosiga brevicollis TaxID=81824 RepID=A9V606_MONBE|nr:uncharacterized protein MONBRDRAFT_27684 [Monosiga brevicollis MX1]EDQ86903.1 predicted protein [Monosiga brevicollis MX1]|eukprot:XP_001748142.1 hypothetical protein [Monosiga brevicollis MX1]
MYMTGRTYHIFCDSEGVGQHLTVALTVALLAHAIQRPDTDSQTLTSLLSALNVTSNADDALLNMLALPSVHDVIVSCRQLSESWSSSDRRLLQVVQDKISALHVHADADTPPVEPLQASSQDIPGSVTNAQPADPSSVSEQPPSQTVPEAQGHGRSDAHPPALGFADVESIVEDTWRQIRAQILASTPAQPVVEKDRRLWRDVRVFVSSTFADMFSEREVLVRQVFPRLRAWGEARRLRIIDCDLRWGVPKESSPETVFRACLGELDRCIEAETNPFFINLLGHRYGWVPSDSELPASIATQYDWPSNISITHMEILHGAMRTGNPNAAFFFRRREALSNIPESFLPRFVDSSKLGQVALNRLKEELRTAFGDRCHDYDAEFERLDDSTGTEKALLHRLDGLAEDVFQFLTKALEAQYPLMEGDPSMVEELAAPSERVLAEQEHNHIGRDDEIARVVEYCREPVDDEHRPIMTLSGPPDPKDIALQLLVKCAETTQEANHVQNVWVLTYLSLGTVFNTCHFYVQLLKDDADGKFAASLVEMFRKALARRSSSELPLVLLVANLDLLVIGSEILQLLFLNGDRLRVAMSIDHGALAQADVDEAIRMQKTVHSRLTEGLHRLAKASIDSVENEESAKQLPNTGITDFGLAPLDRSERQLVIERLLGAYNKQLDDEQMTLLLDNPGSHNFFWLTAVCEELRVYGVFETVTTRIRQLPPEVPALCLQIWQRVEQEDRSGLLKEAALYIASLFTGVTEDELLDVLFPFYCEYLETIGQPVANSTLQFLGTWLSNPIVAGIKQLGNSADVNKGDLHRALFEYRCRVADVMLARQEPSRQQPLARLLVTLQNPERTIKFWQKAILQRASPLNDINLRLSLLFQLSCRQPVMDNGPRKAKPLKMCMNCAMKPGRRPIAFRQFQTCIRCEGMVPGHLQANAWPDERTVFSQPAYLCLKHSRMDDWSTATFTKCIFCNGILMDQATWYPVLLCMTCARTGGKVCCHTEGVSIWAPS